MSSSSKCSHVKKAECLDRPTSCHWIVGKGCRKGAVVVQEDKKKEKKVEVKKQEKETTSDIPLAKLLKNKKKKIIKTKPCKVVSKAKSSSSYKSAVSKVKSSSSYKSAQSVGSEQFKSAVSNHYKSAVSKQPETPYKSIPESPQLYKKELPVIKKVLSNVLKSDKSSKSRRMVLLTACIDDLDNLLSQIVLTSVKKHLKLAKREIGIIISNDGNGDITKATKHLETTILNITKMRKKVQKVDEFV